MVCWGTLPIPKCSKWKRQAKLEGRGEELDGSENKVELVPACMSSSLVNCACLHDNRKMHSKALLIGQLKKQAYVATVLFGQIHPNRSAVNN